MLGKKYLTVLNGSLEQTKMKKMLIFLICGYQKILSPLLPPVCRFTPSCSHYAIEAIQQHGSLKGSLLAGYRILRCHPFCRGGYDPVPVKK